MPPSCSNPPFLSFYRKYYLTHHYRRNITFAQTVMASQQFAISLPVCSLKLIKKSGCIELLYRWVHATSVNITDLTAYKYFVFYMNSYFAHWTIFLIMGCILGKWVGEREIIKFHVFHLNLLYEISRTYLKVTFQDDVAIGNFRSLVCGF